ncbi:hypothetical protein AB4Z45_04335 [Paenibacillus sp. MCAF9]
MKREMEGSVYAINKLYKKNISFFIASSFIIILLDLLFANSVLIKENDQLLTLGIALDFVVVIPLLLYFLWFRVLKFKIASIIPFALLGYLALTLFVPNTDQETMNAIKYFLIPLPPFILALKIYDIAAAYKRYRKVDNHPIETLRKSLEETIRHPKIAALLTHELSVFYYALFAWKETPFIRTGAASFSYHKNSNKLITLLVFSKVLIIEGVCMHILLAQWSHTAAWLLSLGNVYIIMLLIADYRAMCLNPILVSDQQIRFQYGIQLYSDMNINTIASISAITFEKLAKDKMKKTTKILGTEPNVHLMLKEEITVTTAFGIREQIDQIYLFVDKPHEFQTKCQQLMEVSNKDSE